MSDKDDALEDEGYEEYDEFDDEDDERGLSGFVVLMMGVIMLSAFLSVVWIAYQQGRKSGIDAQTPYVAAEPEPIKIQSVEADDDTAEPEVYDVFDGEPEAPTTIVEKEPEEPVDRTPEDVIGALAADAGDAADDVSARIDDLAQEDARNIEDAAQDAVEDVVSTVQTAADNTASTIEEVVSDAVAQAPAASADPASGSHVVQVGAFGSTQEADAVYNRLENRLGDYLDGKGPNIQQADVNGRTYHRLRIGPFFTRAAAGAFCTGLKERGQDCLVKATG